VAATVLRVQLTDAELVVAAAQAGADVVRRKYGSPLTRRYKASTDFATDADIEAEQAIRDLVCAARPGDAFLGEEGGAAGSADAARTWLVDPLCGTLNYAARTPLVAVNIALRSNDRVTVAASADPLSGEVFWTDGRAAHERADDVDRLLEPSASSTLLDVNLDPPYPNADRFRAVRLLAEPEIGPVFRPRVSSTSLALAWVAAGRRAGYLTDGDVRDSVHFASGIALCQAAGCIVTDLRGEPLHSGAGGLLAAADQPTHTALLAIVARQFAAAGA
jgi:myo-inositol-1(or 4)-monophosphatase